MPLSPQTEPTNTSVAQDELAGATLDGRYAVIRLLNEGGMAKIYLARHTGLGREVAVKVLKPKIAADPEIVKRFINEGRAAGTLGHPNIVECTDMGTTAAGEPYLVLEYLVGRTIAAEIQENGPLAPARVARIGLRMADALGTAHAAGIVHRDLKSENVFLARRRGGREVVKVLDFGISKFDFEQSNTQKGCVLGTPDFMSPEQVIDAGDVDSRSDVYSLGVILYDMLAGQYPFAGVKFPMVLHAIAFDAPPSLTSFRTDIPPGLVAVINCAMAKRREDRFDSMASLYAALEPFAERIGDEFELPAREDDRVSSLPERVSLAAFAETMAEPASDEDKRVQSINVAAPISSTVSRPAPAERKKRRYAGMAALGVSSALLLALGIYTLGKPAAPTSPVQTAADTSVQQQIVTMNVRITPESASVTVDGKQSIISNGSLRLEGFLGTVHHVTAQAGGVETNVDVALTEHGALPSHIEVIVPIAPVSQSAVEASPPRVVSSGAPTRSTKSIVAPVIRDDR